MLSKVCLTFSLVDMSSFDCSSPSELDRKFLGEQSLPSSLSLELSTSRPLNETFADGYEAKLSFQASLHMSSEAISGSPAPSQSDLNAQQTNHGHLAIPLQGKSSTPYILPQKQKKAAFFDPSSSDLTAPQMSWDVSLITSESNSPKQYMELSAVELTRSPNPQSAHP